MFKQYAKIFLFIFFVSIFISSTYAENFRMIKLKDGSTLKGQVLKLEQGLYSIQTPQLGIIQIAESDVLSIQQGSQNQAQPINTNQISSQDLQSQVNAVQQTILSNPEMMGQIELLLQNSEIQTLLSDPQLMNSIMSYDMTTIENNQNIQQLMQNPEMQQMIQAIQSQSNSQ